MGNCSTHCPAGCQMALDVFNASADDSVLGR